VAARALVDDEADAPASTGDEEAPKARVFVSRGARTSGPPPAAPGAAPDAGRPASSEPRTFGRFARDADGNFARPGGPPKNPDLPNDGRAQPRFNDGGGSRGPPSGGRFGAPAPGRGAAAGANAGRGAGRDSDKGEKGRRGRVDDGPAVSGRMATEARRNARASRKDERDAKAIKKERVEFLEVPAEGMNLEVLAELLAVNSADVIKALFMKGIMTTVNMVRALACARAAGGSGLCALFHTSRPCAEPGQGEGVDGGRGL
jgi:translation initiation factor IF-2